MSNELQPFSELFMNDRQWLKFSDYEIYNDKKDIYICPKSNAGIESYAPMSLNYEIIFDIFDIAFELENSNNKPEDLILSFVKKYGLFGLYRKYAYFDLNNNVQLKKTYPFVNLYTLKLSNKCNYNEFMKQYFPKIEVASYPDFTTSPDVFWSNYSEKVDDIAGVIKYIWNNYRVWDKETINCDLDRKNRPIADEIAIYPEYDEKSQSLKIVWGFRTLYDALNIIIVNHIVSKDKKIVLCTECSKPIIADTDFTRLPLCSSECRNKHLNRQGVDRKKRLRSKLKKLSAEFINSSVSHDSNCNLYFNENDTDTKRRFEEYMRLKEFKNILRADLKRLQKTNNSKE